MKRQIALVLLAALLVALCAPTAVLARSQDPNNPEPLLPDQPRTGTLPGAPAGSFAYFAVEYPGGDQELVVRMTPRPSDPSNSNQIALNVYGPDGLIGASRTAQETDPSVRVFRYRSDAPAHLLIQMYNYTLADTITYTIVASGISAPAPTMAPASAESVSPPTAAPEVLPETGDMSGTLVGSTGGAFARAVIAYPGDGRDLIVTAAISPDDPVLASAVGFIIYAPDGRPIAQSTTTATPGERRATLSSSVAGTYTVQLHNYAEGAMVRYALHW